MIGAHDSSHAGDVMAPLKDCFLKCETLLITDTVPSLFGEKSP